MPQNTDYMMPLLSDADYRKADGISNSMLSDFAKTPAFYHAKHIAGMIESPDTDTFRFGRLVHASVLESDNYIKATEILPNVNARTKEGKQTIENFKQENDGKQFITEDENLIINRITASVYNHPSAKRLLDDSEFKEMSFFWKDKETGLQLKARVDAFSEKHKIISDLKTTSNAGKYEFIKSAFSFRYHVQAAFYIEALKSCIDESDRDFTFIAVEKSAPYLVATYFATQEQLELGRAIMRQELQALANCYEKDIWAGYSDKLEELGLPYWASKAYSEQGII